MKHCFSEHERAKVLKDYIERIMNEEHDLHHNVEGDVVEDPVVCVSRDGVFQELNESRKIPSTFISIIGVIAISERVGVMAEIYQRVMD